MLGPFEEEEEGTGIASDVVKVMGEDPATPGLLPKGIDPGTVTIPQYRVNKTKQHTHTHTHGVRWGCSQLEHATSLLQRLQVTHNATNSEAYCGPSAPDYRHEVVRVDIRVIVFVQ